MMRAAAALAGLALLAPPAAAQRPDRSVPPPLGPPPTLTLPAIARHRLPNGLEVLLLEKHGVPIVQVNLVVKTGSAMDPADTPGLAGMTAALLDEGAGRRGALELADAIDYLGADLSVTAEQHATTIALHVPVARLDSALALMADVALRPTFPADEVERQRRRRLTALGQQHDEARIVAQTLFVRALFGEDHPYGRRAGGVEASVRGFTAEDLRAFYRRWFRPGNAALVVVGDVRARDVLPRLEAAFGGWARGAVPAPSWPDAAPIEGRRVYLVDKPGAPQSEVVMGSIGVSRATPDFFSLLVLNTALGGAFTSRLNQNLREDKGYSYGAGSSFAFDALRGPFSARAGVHTEVTDKALAEFLKELEAIGRPLPDAELARARNYVALRFPESFQTVSSTAAQLGELVIYGLPLDYYGGYTKAVLGVRAADVERAARRYIDPARLVIVIVGDRARIEPGIRALDLGPLEILTIEDVLGPVPAVDADGSRWTH
jgi:predicted Zn-dependent peptidase